MSNDLLVILICVPLYKGYPFFKHLQHTKPKILAHASNLRLKDMLCNTGLDTEPPPSK